MEQHRRSPFREPDEAIHQHPFFQKIVLWERDIDRREVYDY